MRTPLFALALSFAALVHAQPTVQRGEPLIRKGAFGVQLSPISADEAKVAGIPAGTSAKVVAVVPGQTAENLKVQPGDIVVSFGKEPFAGPPSVFKYIRANNSGTPVEAEVIRDGKRVKLSGTLIARPKMQSADLDVTYDQVLSNGKRIRVIITTPKGKGPFPAVFLIGGIGAYSIDGDYEKTAYGNILAPLAKKYAVVRVDKPGQGDSEGPEYTDLLFDTESDAYLQALRLTKTLPQIDAKKIAIFGHSMGGSFAPIVASQEPVAGIASSATLCKSFLEYHVENSRRQSLLAGAGYAEVDEAMKGLSAVGHYIFNEGLSPKEVIEKYKKWESAVREMTPDLKTFSGVGIPFFQQLAKKNLPDYWAKSSGKVLSLWGENDFISTESDQIMLVDVVNKARPGTAEYVKLANSDHGFFQTSSFLDSMTKWGRPGNAFNPNVIPALESWLEKLFKG